MTSAMDVSAPVTRGELRAEIEQLEIRLEQRLALMATKADLEIWAGALMERMSAEIARHTRAVQEEMRSQVAVIDDKYKDLPGRVSRLEAAVFPSSTTRKRRR